MPSRKPEGIEIHTMWVLCVFVNGTFRDTVCVSIERDVAVSLAAEGNANARKMKAPVEFVVIETMTDHAFTGQLGQAFAILAVDPHSNN